ncbi:TcaA NTF2-like domain-containing protein [Bacillus cereus]|uniref:TcaA NTF2-like domain-containing protein n=1 Tax=Bacillus cereus TaxID=1396 RepID=UPI00115590AE|nr:hypothetical protein [Bacillus cereus]
MAECPYAFGGNVIKNSSVFKSLTVSEKEETATNSYEVVKEQLKDYSKNYVQAHNEGDFSLVKKFYDEGTTTYVSTEDYIKHHTNKFKIDLYDITLQEAPERIGNSSTYNVKTDMEYRYDTKEKKIKEVVKNRTFQVTLTSNNQLIFNKTNAVGQSVCYNLNQPAGQNKIDCAETN